MSFVDTPKSRAAGVKNSTAIEVCKRDWRVPRQDCRGESHGGLQIHTNKSAPDVPQSVGLVVVLVVVSNVVWCSGVVPPASMTELGSPIRVEL